MIPNSVTSIEGGAFSRCTGLASVVIPDSVVVIRKQTFWKCTGLTKVLISNSVTSIGVQAFSGCTGLTSIMIPDSVTSIEREAFSECTGLASVIINPKPDFTTIGRDAFQGCTGLPSTTIPNSATSVDSVSREQTLPHIVDAIRKYADGRWYYFRIQDMALVQLNNMESHSEPRGHEFDRMGAIENLIPAYEDLDEFNKLRGPDESPKCPCPRCKARDINGFFGVDRGDDEIGYSHKRQKLSIIHPYCNTKLKPNTPKTLRTAPYPVHFPEYIVSGVYQRMKHNMDMIAKKESRTQEEQDEYDEWRRQTYRLTREGITEMILKMKDENSRCAECNCELSFGDKDTGLMIWKDDITQVSIDRINNICNLYFEGGVRFVCQLHQEVVNLRHREDFKNPKSGDEFILKVRHIREIIVILQSLLEEAINEEK